uniref:MADF domain-containing protein n=1 Tax=Glossina brevipalpis TaxID=37001 RepID=A0A1A9WMD4_9MUSC
MPSNYDDVDLIRLVETYPVLYAKYQGRGQKIASVKDRAWRKVSQTLKKSERACITRWKSIRDRFGKELRRVQENPQESTNWELFPYLLFLKDHYKQGCANIESIECIKYEPKARKRKSTRLAEEFSDDDQYNELTTDDVEQRQLIALVKEHNVLYDRCKVRDSKNLAAKNEAWHAISDALGVSEEFCYTKWKKLRDRFSREYRQHQLNPEKEVRWIYFQDLMFLESHYRKGKPLPLAQIKRKTISIETSPPNDTWDPELSGAAHEYTEEENQLITEVPDSELKDVPDKSIDEFSSTNSKGDQRMQTNNVMQIEYLNDNQPASSINDTTATTTCLHNENDAEEKLSNLISNMESVVKQSQECLKSLQLQKQHYKQEFLEQNQIQTIWQADVMRKIDTLLTGLSLEQRENAERKILQFLCECQIRTLNNENIEDVVPVQI